MTGAYGYWCLTLKKKRQTVFQNGRIVSCSHQQEMRAPPLQHRVWSVILSVTSQWWRQCLTVIFLRVSLGLRTLGTFPQPYLLPRCILWWIFCSDVLPSVFTGLIVLRLLCRFWRHIDIKYLIGRHFIKDRVLSSKLWKRLYRTGLFLLQIFGRICWWHHLCMKIYLEGF